MTAWQQKCREWRWHSWGYGAAGVALLIVATMVETGSLSGLALGIGAGLMWLSGLVWGLIVEGLKP